MSDISWDYSIREFLEQASSSRPVPGGGSVAALAAALGTSMTSMVGRLSQGDSYAAIEPLVTDALHTMSSLANEFEQLMRKDMEAFNTYMEALKLPKSTENERLARNKALQAAVLGAIDVPLSLMEACRSGIASTKSIADSSNKNVVSDLGIGAILFDSAAQSAMLTVQINLSALKDPHLKQHYEQAAAALMEEVGELKHATLLLVNKRIAGQSVL